MTKSVFSLRYDRLKQALVAARRDRGLSQVQVAELLGRPQSFVSKYERGERRLDVIEFLEVATTLGVDPILLLQQVFDGE
jgi:transcriptional regulator with XRE-family HTH domain